MPLYEYLCGECSKSFTILQKTQVKPGDTLCPYCGDTDVQKQFSTFASKGTGSSESSDGGQSCPPTGCGCC